MATEPAPAENTAPPAPPANLQTMILSVVRRAHAANDSFTATPAPFGTV